MSNGNVSPTMFTKMDDLDLELIPLLMAGLDSKEIAKKMQKPLSTIQRRKRVLFERGLLELRVIPNYKKLGFKRGLLHVYVSNGDAQLIGEKLVGLKGIISASLHIGNSDIVGEFVYRDSSEILSLISDVKSIEGVEHTVWSEEVLEIPKSDASTKFLPLK
ncbi:MAG: Lrp/AsnC family transcriptional regulator [Nitrososphaera sp.]